MIDKEYTEAEIIDLAIELLREKKETLFEAKEAYQTEYNEAINDLNAKMDKLMEYRTNHQQLKA